MARAGECDCCGQQVSYLFAVQYKNGKDQHKILCPTCYDNGHRVIVNDSGNLYVVRLAEPYYGGEFCEVDPPKKTRYPNIWQDGFGPENKNG